MKILVPALMLCFMASVSDADCASRAVSSDNKFLAYTEFTFTCHNGMKGWTKVYDDKVISYGSALVLPLENDARPRYSRGAAVEIITSPMKDESECGFMAYSHSIHSFVPPSTYNLLWSRPQVTLFTKGYTGHRNEDDECKDKQEVTGLFVGSPIVIMMDSMTDSKGIPYPRLAFNSLVIMHLNHLHGEGVFIQWEQWERDIFPSFPRDIFPWTDGIPLP